MSQMKDDFTFDQESFDQGFKTLAVHDVDCLILDDICLMTEYTMRKTKAYQPLD